MQESGWVSDDLFPWLVCRKLSCVWQPIVRWFCERVDGLTGSSLCITNLTGWENFVEVISIEIYNPNKDKQVRIIETSILAGYLHWMLVAFPASKDLYLKESLNCWGLAAGKPRMTIMVFEKTMRFIERPACLIGWSYIFFLLLN